jgi:ferric-dicitrate binding protein FerR (iron transport regulator)
VRLRRHIAPHRLASASGRERARVDRHIASCARCAAAHDRLVRARAAMTDIAAQPAPELGWDHIGVRVYWSTSSARHAALRQRERGWWRRPPVLALVGTLALGAAAGFALTMWSSARWSTSDEPRALAPAAPKVAAPVRTVAPVASPLRGLVTFASGAVAVDGAEPRARTSEVDVARLFDGPIAQGARLRTGSGRLVVQFGETSGFALAPGSAVSLRRFDDRAVELVVEEGAIEVELSHRRPDQTFAVVAGRHRVVVHGTAFQVARRAGRLAVECARGRVLVSDGAHQVPVAAGRELRVLEQGDQEQAIDPLRLDALERSLARPLLPAWIDSKLLLETSSTVVLAAPAGRAVRVDGVEVGAGSLALRVTSGRHHLEVEDGSGRFAHGAWIDAEPRARQDASAGSDGVVRVLRGSGGTATGEDLAARARSVRRRQLQQALADSPRARRCMSPLEKRDLVSGSSVPFDVGVNADGSQGHLNVVRSNVPTDVERCLRAVVDGVELPAGPQATVRFRLAF